MNSMQPFGYEGIPGTCIWCGRRLNKPGSARYIGEHAGGRYFDVESCATQFGVRMAELGKRLHAMLERARGAVGNGAA